MASIAWSDVIGIPGANIEFASIDPTLAGVVSILAVVNSWLDPLQFDGEGGPILNAARAYLAAHMVSLGKLGMGGVLTAEAMGGNSRQYAPPTARSEFMTTSYGRAYWSLIGAQAHGPRLL